VDQPGFYLLPTVVSTYAPVGQTPILHERLVRDHLSVISAITLEGKLLMMEQARTFKSGGCAPLLEAPLAADPGQVAHHLGWFADPSRPGGQIVPRQRGGGGSA
jgi:hypothetical protein